MQLNVGAQLKVVQQYSFQMDVVMLPSTEEDPSGGGEAASPPPMQQVMSCAHWVNQIDACCAECGMEGGISLKVCKSCMSVSYCNAECQRAHWGKEQAGNH
jgi:hypothetical protein